MISIDNITVEFGGNALFENISFLIKEKETLIAICLGAIAKVEAQINLGKVGKALN